MDVRFAVAKDFESWITLSREVEPLFGPMADEPDFREALQRAIALGLACCIDDPGGLTGSIAGGAVISIMNNEIAWLAVSKKHRRKGYGNALLAFAIALLNPDKPILVQTFDELFPEGRAARGLYRNFGFSGQMRGEVNPAGIPTVIMRLGKGERQIEDDEA